MVFTFPRIARPHVALRRPLTRLALVAVGLAAFLDLSASQAAALNTVKVRFSVPQVDGEPVVDAAWIDERMHHADIIFAPAELAFVKGAVDTRTDHVEAHTREDRHRFGAEVAPEVVNIFVVNALRDIDEPERFRQGVHWRSQTHRGTHYIIISKVAGPTTLAHELGHFFGNHGHSDTPGNIMSYQRGEAPPFFDGQQLRIIGRHVRRFLRSGELISIPPGRPAPAPAAPAEEAAPAE